MADNRKYKWLESAMGSKLNNKTKCVAWALFKHANTTTLYGFPNLTTIDAVLGGPGAGKNIHRNIRELICAGFIIKHQQKVGDYMSNGYLLVFPAPRDESKPPHGEEGAPHGDLWGSQGDGLTLSTTLSSNSFMNSSIEKPSASEIQEEMRKMGDLYFSGSQDSSDSEDRQIAALPRLADEELGDDFLSQTDELLLGSPVRQYAASPHVAANWDDLDWDSKSDEIPNEDW